jgi:hypothetical protein
MTTTRSLLPRRNLYGHLDSHEQFVSPKFFTVRSWSPVDRKLYFEPADYPVPEPFSSLLITSSILKDVKTSRPNTYFQRRENCREFLKKHDNELDLLSKFLENPTIGHREMTRL